MVSDFDIFMHNLQNCHYTLKYLQKTKAVVEVFALKKGMQCTHLLELSRGSLPPCFQQRQATY